MKRKIEVLADFSSNLVRKLFAKINTGSYGDVALPDDSDAVSIKSDTDVKNEYEDENSGVVTNRRESYFPIRMKGKSKVVISTHLHNSGSNEVESSIGKFFEAVFGKKEVIASDRGAEIKIEDPLAEVAGIVITTAGALIGTIGNYVTLTIVNGGSTGSASIAKSGKDYTLTVYNDSTVEDVVTALDGDADLVCVADSNGDDATDLFIDLMASRGLVSLDKLYANGGAKKGFLYSNKEAPRKDMTIIQNNERSGQVVTGFIPEKITIEVADKIPTVKVEGEAKKVSFTGQAQLAVAPVAATKLYLGSASNRFIYDESAPSYIDVISQTDLMTYKSKANKIVGSGTDMTGNYIQVQNAVTASLNDWVVFHEPENHKPEYKPLNGMAGSLTLDTYTFSHVRNVKFEYANNFQVHNNIAFTDTIVGFDPSKEISCKISCEVLVKLEHQALINQLRQNQVVALPLTYTVGKTTGNKYVFFVRNVYVKSPDLNNKNDEVQTIGLEMELKVLPETIGESFSLNHC